MTVGLLASTFTPVRVPSEIVVDIPLSAASLIVPEIELIERGVASISPSTTV